MKTPNPGGTPKTISHMVNAPVDVLVTGMVASVSLDPSTHPSAHPAYLRVESRADGVQLACPIHSVGRRCPVGKRDK